MSPYWLTILSWVALGSGFASAAWLTVEQVRHPQRMWIMDVVWPVTALYMGPLAVWAYYRMGIGSAKDHMPKEKKERREKLAEPIDDPVHKKEVKAGKPFWEIVFVGVTHCGSGCTLGDIWAEFMIFFTGFAFAGDAPDKIFQSYLVMDYILAYLLGIVFQYFSIAPMRGISGFKGIWAAIKADTLSLTAFEMGLFGWMAIEHFFIFHPDVKPDQATYWFMMQIGMCIGFLTAYPMNWWLIKKGLKEAM